MISFPFFSLSKRPGATLAGVFSLALGCVLLLCGAGSVPVENLLPQGAMQGDLNAGGHNLTNAATVSATNVVVSGSLTAPTSFTLPFSQLTGTPTTPGGYGITAVPWSDVTGAPSFITASGAPVQSVAGRTGVITLAASDVSGLAASATTDTTNAGNITSGTLAAARVATLNQNTTGSAGSVALSGITGAGTGVLTAAADAVNGSGGFLTVGGGVYQASSATLTTLGGSNPFTAGSGVSFSGTWPAITITASGGSTSWVTKTANYNLVAGDHIAADSTGGTFTLTLPSATGSGAEIDLVDPQGSWATTNVTVAGTVNGITNMTLDLAGSTVRLIDVGGTAGWRAN